MQKNEYLNSVSIYILNFGYYNYMKTIKVTVDFDRFCLFAFQKWVTPIR